MTLSSDGKRWIGAVYFPRGQQSFPDIKKKFAHDLDGVKANNAEGLAFVTNQELRLGERKILTELMPEVDVQIYHLERIASLLNTPSFYGIRMEFLDIEMSKEEQLSFFADQDQRLARIEGTLAQMAIGIDGYKTLLTSTPPKQQTNDEDEEWDEFLKSLVQWMRLQTWQMSFVKKFGLIVICHCDTRLKTALKLSIPKYGRERSNLLKRVIQQYGEENLGPYSDFRLGYA